MVAAGLIACAVAAQAPAAVDQAACRAGAPRHAQVTSVRGMACADAAVDLTAYRSPFAVSFRTPGGFTCTRTFRRARASGFRCANGPRAYRFRVTGALRPAVHLVSGAIDGTLTVTRCRRSGATGLTLNARAPGMRLTIRATPRRPGTLRLRNLDPENGIDAAGSLASLVVGRGGSIVAAGRFTSGGTAAFRLAGDCR